MMYTILSILNTPADREALFKCVIQEMDADKVLLHKRLGLFFYYIQGKFNDEDLGRIKHRMEGGEKVVEKFEKYLTEKCGVEQHQEKVFIPVKINDDIIFLEFNLDSTDMLYQDNLYNECLEYLINVKFSPIENSGRYAVDTLTSAKKNAREKYKTLIELYHVFLKNRSGYVQNEYFYELSSDLFEISMLDLYSFMQNFYTGNTNNALWGLQQHTEKMLKKIIIQQSDETTPEIDKTHSIQDLINKIPNLKNEKLKLSGADIRYKEQKEMIYVYNTFEKYVVFMKKLISAPNTKGLLTHKQKKYKTKQKQPGGKKIWFVTFVSWICALKRN